MQAGSRHSRTMCSMQMTRASGLLVIAARVLVVGDVVQAADELHDVGLPDGVGDGVGGFADAQGRWGRVCRLQEWADGEAGGVGGPAISSTLPRCVCGVCENDYSSGHMTSKW